jgi:hypothetical protein
MAKRASAPFLWNGQGFELLVVSKVTATRIEFIAFFKPKCEAFKAVTYCNFDAQFVAKHWRALAMAYVVGNLDVENTTPDRVEIVDHNATARAPAKIVGKKHLRLIPWPPRLSDIDAYLGTRFCRAIAEREAPDTSSTSPAQHRAA